MGHPTDLLSRLINHAFDFWHQDHLIIVIHQYFDPIDHAYNCPTLMAKVYELRENIYATVLGKHPAFTSCMSCEDLSEAELVEIGIMRQGALEVRILCTYHGFCRAKRAMRSDKLNALRAACGKTLK